MTAAGAGVVAPAQDFSFTIASAHQAVEAGLSAAERYRTGVPRRSMKERTQRGPVP